MPESELDQALQALENMKSWCKHIPENTFGYMWECKCGKVKEIRMPKELIQTAFPK